MTVQALYIDPKGIYPSLLGPANCWGLPDSDARRYAGPDPVVAHPPCQLWGKMAVINFKRWGGEHNRPGNDGGCFASALLAVRTFGGVLEHPATSYAWAAHGLMKPQPGAGWQQMPSGLGWVCEVWQSAYGHKARKRTWLYYHSINEPFDLDWSCIPGTHQIGAMDRKRGAASNKPVLTGRAASATPIKFAKVLIQLAEHAVS